MVATARLIIVREKIQVITIYNLNRGCCCNLITFKVEAFEFSLNFYCCSFRFDNKIFMRHFNVFTISRIQPWWLVLFLRCFVFMLFCALFNNPTIKSQQRPIHSANRTNLLSFRFVDKII